MAHNRTYHFRSLRYKLYDKEVILIRHAQGEHNVSSNYQFDPPLTSVGVEQVEQCRATLSEPLPDIVFVSPLRRTLQTATGVFPDSKKTIALDCLREVLSDPCNLRLPVQVAIASFPKVDFSRIKDGPDPEMHRFPRDLKWAEESVAKEMSSVPEATFKQSAFRKRSHRSPSSGVATSCEPKVRTQGNRPPLITMPDHIGLHHLPASHNSEINNVESKFYDEEVRSNLIDNKSPEKWGQFVNGERPSASGCASLPGCGQVVSNGTAARRLQLQTRESDRESAVQREEDDSSFDQVLMVEAILDEVNPINVAVNVGSGVAAASAHIEGGIHTGDKSRSAFRLLLSGGEPLVNSDDQPCPTRHARHLRVRGADSSKTQNSSPAIPRTRPEDEREVAARVQKTLDVLQACSERCIALVTHASFLQALLRTLAQEQKTSKGPAGADPKAGNRYTVFDNCEARRLRFCRPEMPTAKAREHPAGGASFAMPRRRVPASEGIEAASASVPAVDVGRTETGVEAHVVASALFALTLAQVRPSQGLFGEAEKFWRVKTTGAKKPGKCSIMVGRRAHHCPQARWKLIPASPGQEHLQQFSVSCPKCLAGRESVFHTYCTYCDINITNAVTDAAATREHLSSITHLARELQAHHRYIKNWGQELGPHDLERASQYVDQVEKWSATIGNHRCTRFNIPGILKSIRSELQSIKADSDPSPIPMDTASALSVSELTGDGSQHHTPSVVVEEVTVSSSSASTAEAEAASIRSSKTDVERTPLKKERKFAFENIGDENTGSDEAGLNEITKAVLGSLELLETRQLGLEGECRAEAGNCSSIENVGHSVEVTENESAARRVEKASTGTEGANAVNEATCAMETLGQSVEGRSGQPTGAGDHCNASSDPMVSEGETEVIAVKPASIRKRRLTVAHCTAKEKKWKANAELEAAEIFECTLPVVRSCNHQLPEDSLSEEACTWSKLGHRTAYCSCAERRYDPPLQGHEFLTQFWVTCSACRPDSPPVLHTHCSYCKVSLAGGIRGAEGKAFTHLATFHHLACEAEAHCSYLAANRSGLSEGELHLARQYSDRVERWAALCDIGDVDKRRKLDKIVTDLRSLVEPLGSDTGIGPTSKRDAAASPPSSPAVLSAHQRGQSPPSAHPSPTSLAGESRSGGETAYESGGSARGSPKRRRRSRSRRCWQIMNICLSIGNPPGITSLPVVDREGFYGPAEHAVAANVSLVNSVELVSAAHKETVSGEGSGEGGGFCNPLSRNADSPAVSRAGEGRGETVGSNRELRGPGGNGSKEDSCLGMALEAQRPARVQQSAVSSWYGGKGRLRRHDYFPRIRAPLRASGEIENAEERLAEVVGPDNEEQNVEEEPPLQGDEVAHRILNGANWMDEAWPVHGRRKKRRKSKRRSDRPLATVVEGDEDEMREARAKECDDSDSANVCDQLKRQGETLSSKDEDGPDGGGGSISEIDESEWQSRRTATSEADSATGPQVAHVGSIAANILQGSEESFDDHEPRLVWKDEDEGDEATVEGDEEADIDSERNKYQDGTTAWRGDKDELMLIWEENEDEAVDGEERVDENSMVGDGTESSEGVIEVVEMDMGKDGKLTMEAYESEMTGAAAWQTTGSRVDEAWESDATEKQVGRAGGRLRATDRRSACSGALASVLAPARNAGGQGSCDDALELDLDHVLGGSGCLSEGVRTRAGRQGTTVVFRGS
mmetsp:Transcript_67387/g.179956  ORF Transcript_67387/g.179956 Transcript_67387/m.179956 type:complete len:1708 (+) Transcript_67387:68-5191(+)